ncbi:MAG: phosphoribosylamine--glycine ligase [Clostridiales bacterium]|nr:phosphoribosylamine--glycine ligase [Clostridiales bacterium]
MDVLLVGGGGREHALVKKLRESAEIDRLYALPGNAGMEPDAVGVPIAATDIDGIVRFAAESRVGYAIVAPDDPLVLGAVDRLTAAGVPCFGPTAAAAAIEGSKSFAKRLMEKYGIPTARYRVFSSADAALAYARAENRPLVVKADGLALGKGVAICPDFAAAEDAIRSMMIDRAFGDSGGTVVIEEFLTGPEVSVLAFTDGQTIAPMASAMDHKRALDGDLGPNTGGMGAIAPNPLYTPEIAARCMKEIFEPTVAAMNAEGRAFRGCLYFGLMLTADGPKVIEYNCRFGDPEAQAVLPLLDGDLFSIMRAVTGGYLADVPVRVRTGASCCVVLASGGYPGKYRTGLPIAAGEMPENVSVFYAGVRRGGENLVTAGGRVAGVTAVAGDLPAAVALAYEGASRIHFEGAYMRRDIGGRALGGKE